MTKLYQKINIDNLDSISNQCYSIIEKAGISESSNFYHLDLNTPDRFKQLADLNILMKKLGLYNHWILTSIVVSYSDIPIHIDMSPSNHFNYSFNIPIKNTKNTYTVFYEISKDLDQIIVQIPDGSPYGYYPNDPKKVKPIDSIEMTVPVIINTQIPHNVIHKSKNFPRINLLCRLGDSFNLDDFNWT
jgi:hypothetical protein